MRKTITSTILLLSKAPHVFLTARLVVCGSALIASAATISGSTLSDSLSNQPTLYKNTPKKPTLLALVPDSIRETPSRYGRYPFIRLVPSDIEPEPLTDDEFFDVSARVIFPVNKFVLPQNDSLLRLLETVVFPQLRRDSLRLLGLQFRGAASPEGPLRWNRTLGRNRMNALYRFVGKHMALSPADSSLHSREIDVEDYHTLCLMMRREGDRDYGLVQALCDVYLTRGDLVTLKRRLKEAHGGRLWRRLLRTYYPTLRSARFVMYLEDRRPSMPLRELTASGLPYVLPSLPRVERLALPVLVPRREVLSVKTNVLLDLAYMPGYNRWCPIPNVAVEYYPLHGHFTFGASFDCPWWQDYDAHKYFQVRNYQLESRYYLRSGDIRRNAPGTGAAFRGIYLQAYVHAGLYGIMFDADRGWMGEGFGGGVGAGYVLPLSRNGHWRLEFQLQAGFFSTRYDPFQHENPVNPAYRDNLYYYKWTKKPELFKKRQYRFNWLGPTRVGITLSYDLLYRRVTKRGVSFRDYEIVWPGGANGANGANGAYKAHGASEAEQERRSEP